jgi:hypothetical protein
MTWNIYHETNFLQIILLGTTLEQLQQFGKLTWHPYNFGKQEKLASNSLANQLGKNRNLAKLTSPRAYMRAPIVVGIVVSL